MVGDSLTVADIAIFGAFVPAFGLVLDAGFRKAMPNLTAHFERIAKLPEVIKV